MKQFQKGDIVKRITEPYRVQILKVLEPCNENHSVKVVALNDLQACGQSFYVQESSLTLATNLDRLRNLSDKRLSKLLKIQWLPLFERMTKENLIDKWQKLYQDYDGSMMMLLETDEAQELSQSEMEYLFQKLQNKYQTKIRVRISIIDKYQHVCDRINPVYEYMWNSKTNFYPNQQERYAVLSLVRSYPEIQFETCAEPFLVRDTKKYGLSNIIESGCISETETKLFGLTNTATRNYPPQRKNCLCLNCKTELLENRNPFNATTCKPCVHQCKYCYWRD